MRQGIITNTNKPHHLLTTYKEQHGFFQASKHHMAKLQCIAVSSRLRRCCTRNWRSLTHRRRRRGQGGVVRLGDRRCRRVMLRPLVRWSRAQWRLVVALLQPLKTVVVEVASGRRLPEAHYMHVPFLYPFQLPLIWVINKHITCLELVWKWCSLFWYSHGSLHVTHWLLALVRMLNSN